MVRIPVWVWFTPSAFFVVLATVGAAVVVHPSLPGWAVAGSLALVSVSGGLALLGERSAPTATTWAVALALLASAALVHAADHGTVRSSILLAGLPAGWLAFELGSRGAVVAVTATWLVAAAPDLAGTAGSPTSTHRWDDVVTTAGLTMMVLLTWYAGRMLRRAQADVVTRSRSLEREVATTRAIFESVDAALAVFLPDQRVLVNRPAVDLGHGLRMLPATARQSATPSSYEVLEADGVTVAAPGSQAMVRAQRGEEFADLVQWTGPSDSRRAMVCSARTVRLGREAEVATVFLGWDATETLDAARVRDEFIGTVTHELRTPLTAIVGYLDLHEELDPGERTGPAAATFLEGVRRNVRELADHIEALLVTAQPGQPTTAEIDVTAVARSAVAAASERAGAAGLDLTLTGPDSLCAVANETALRQVLDHLLDNALTYTETGGVVVEVAPWHDRLDVSHPTTVGFTLTVSDTGIGMSEHELARVFDRFYRTEAAVRRVLPGLGMGLAATKQLVAAHGGTVTAESTPGAGSRFRVTIPGPRG